MIENNNIENAFFEDNINNGRSILSLGTPESGKTYLMLQYIKYSLNNNIYDEYHLVLPQFVNEQNDSYAFLNNFAHKVFVYNRYDEVVSIKIDKLRVKKKIFFCIDDASAELLQNTDNTFLKLFTTTRHSHHGGLTMWVVVHSAKRILSPIIRQNIRYLFVYNLCNEPLLKTIYEEFLSMQFDNYQTFKEFFKKHVINEKYNAMLWSLRNGVDFNIKSWALQNVQIEVPTKQTSIKPVKEKTEQEKPLKENKKNIFESILKNNMKKNI